MPALHAFPATLAAADVHGEFPVDRRARNLGLKLLTGAGFDERAVAVRAVVRKFRFESFVDLVGGRAMAVGAVLFAGLAAGRLRRELGRTFVEVVGSQPSRSPSRLRRLFLPLAESVRPIPHLRRSRPASATRV